MMGGNRLEKAFVIGDIHGMYDDLMMMLTHWNPTSELLIMVGDYIDRGPASDQVLYWVKEMTEKYPEQFIPLRGNHEKMLMDFLNNPLEKRKLYERNGGNYTLSQLLKVPIESVIEMDAVALAERIKEEFPWLLPLLESTRFYYRFGDHLIVHAGVDLEQEDWRQTALDEFVWIREPFHQGENHTGLNIIFGHTPIHYLHDKDEPWVEDHKWGIDGGRVYGGPLFGIRINPQEVEEVFSEKSDLPSYDEANDQ